MSFTALSITSFCSGHMSPVSCLGDFNYWLFCIWKLPVYEIGVRGTYTNTFQTHFQCIKWLLLWKAIPAVSAVSSPCHFNSLISRVKPNNIVLASILETKGLFLRSTAKSLLHWLFKAFCHSNLCKVYCIFKRDSSKI